MRRRPSRRAGRRGSSRPRRDWRALRRASGSEQAHAERERNRRLPRRQGVDRGSRSRSRLGPEPVPRTGTSCEPATVGRAGQGRRPRPTSTSVAATMSVRPPGRHRTRTRGGGPRSRAPVRTWSSRSLRGCEVDGPDDRTGPRECIVASAGTSSVLTRIAAGVRRLQFGEWSGHDGSRLATAALSGALLLLSATFAFIAPSSTSIVSLVLGLAVAPVCGGPGRGRRRSPGRATRGDPARHRRRWLSRRPSLRETGAQFLAGRPDAAARPASWLVALWLRAPCGSSWRSGCCCCTSRTGVCPDGAGAGSPAIAILAALVTQAHGAFDTAPFRPPLRGSGPALRSAPLWLELLGLSRS